MTRNERPLSASLQVSRLKLALSNAKLQNAAYAKQLARATKQAKHWRDVAVRLGARTMRTKTYQPGESR